MIYASQQSWSCVRWCRWLCVSILSVISGLLLGALFAAAITLWARKLIDGYTGDVLGATEQMFEIGFLLGVAAIIR